MKFTFVKIGKVDRKLNDIAEQYLGRLKSFAKFEVAHYKNADAADKALELLANRQSALIVALDERGHQWSSLELADFIEKKSDQGMVKHLVFVVGGPYGLSETLKAISTTKWSLSKAVFPSDIAWLLVCEQVYRAFNIMSGTPYHHQ